MRRSAGRAARMPAAPAPRRSAVSARRAAPAQPNPRMLRGAARRSLPSGPHRRPGRHRPLRRVLPSRLPQNAPVLRPRHPSDRRARLPKSVNGIAIAPPPIASALGSSRLPPKHRQARQPRRLSRPHLRPRPSSGLPQAPLARLMQSAPPGRVTPSDLTATASAPAISVPGRTHPPRPQPPRLPRQQPLRRRHQLLRRRGPSRLRQLLRLPLQRGPSPRLQPHPSRLNHAVRRHQRPSRSTRLASASTTYAASAGSAVKATG